jgi:hypothetical protein
MIEEEVISKEPVQEPPYKKKVYDILSSNFSDFKLGEQDFYKKLSTDKTYAGKVHDVLIENFSDFKKPKNEFIDSLTFVEPVKKKDQISNLSGEVSSPIQSKLLKGDVTEWYKQTMPDAMFVKSTSDNTRLNKPREMAEDVLYKAAAPIREAKKKADTEIAIAAKVKINFFILFSLFKMDNVLNYTHFFNFAKHRIIYFSKLFLSYMSLAEENH